MEAYQSYQNPGGSSSTSTTMSETEFARISQTVGTNIQKILQNGMAWKLIML